MLVLLFAFILFERAFINMNKETNTRLSFYNRSYARMPAIPLSTDRRVTLAINFATPLSQKTQFHYFHFAIFCVCKILVGSWQCADVILCPVTKTFVG